MPSFANMTSNSPKWKNTPIPGQFCAKMKVFAVSPHEKVVGGIIGNPPFPMKVKPTMYATNEGMYTYHKDEFALDSTTVLTATSS
mmetsp:Transcript_2791/g.3376  ORF Transcript_2791/g.3376 Transcript_2791/m.3376 type:complete len:85 (-) Transcript_2791:94-348(-)